MAQSGLFWLYICFSWMACFFLGVAFSTSWVHVSANCGFFGMLFLALERAVLCAFGVHEAGEGVELLRVVSVWVMAEFVFFASSSLSLANSAQAFSLFFSYWWQCVSAKNNNTAVSSSLLSIVFSAFLLRFYHFWSSLSVVCWLIFAVASSFPSFWPFSALHAHYSVAFSPRLLSWILCRLCSLPFFSPNICVYLSMSSFLFCL